MGAKIKNTSRHGKDYNFRYPLHVGTLKFVKNSRRGLVAYPRFNHAIGRRISTKAYGIIDFSQVRISALEGQTVTHITSRGNLDNSPLKPIWLTCSVWCIPKYAKFINVHMRNIIHEAHRYCTAIHGKTVQCRYRFLPGQGWKSQVITNAANLRYTSLYANREVV